MNGTTSPPRPKMELRNALGSASLAGEAGESTRAGARGAQNKTLGLVLGGEGEGPHRTAALLGQ